MLRTATLVTLLTLGAACEVPTGNDPDPGDARRVHIAHAAPALGSVVISVTTEGSAGGVLAPYAHVVHEASEPGTVTLTHEGEDLSTTIAAEDGTAYAVVLMADEAPRVERYEHRTFSLPRLTLINAVPATLTVEVALGGSRAQADIPFAGSASTAVGTGAVEVRVVREDGSPDPIGTVEMSNAPRFLVVAPGGDGEEFVLLVL